MGKPLPASFCQPQNQPFFSGNKLTLSTKRLVPLFLVLLFALVSQGQTILIGMEGESNFVSRAKADGRFEVPPVAGATWYKESTNTLEPVTDPIGEGISKADDRSAAPALVKRLKELFPAYNVIVVPSAVGGSRIGAWSKGGSLYGRAKIMWNKALAYCSANNINVAHKFIAWEQGGNDVNLLETDGYYVALNQLTNDFVSEFGAERVFGIRIGYDPNYAPATEAEKIMKAHKLVNFNNPNYILSTNAPAAFTLQNEKMQGDGVHWTLKGQNEVGTDLAEAIGLFLTTGNKPVLSEPVAALQSVTTGYINLTPVWSLDFNGDINDQNNNVTVRHVYRDSYSNQPATFSGDAVVLDQSKGLLFSRPFSSATFTLEMRFKLNSPAGKSTAVVGMGEGNNYNKLVVEQSATGIFVIFGETSTFFGWAVDNLNANDYHTYKLTQANGVLKFYVDNVERSSQPATDVFSMDRIGIGAGSYTKDMDGVVDFFRIKNTVDNATPLPVKFKSFKATNIK